MPPRISTTIDNSSHFRRHPTKRQVHFCLEYPVYQILIVSFFILFFTTAGATELREVNDEIILSWNNQKVDLQALQTSMLPLDSQHFAQILGVDLGPLMKTPGLPQWPYRSFIVEGDIDEIEVELSWLSEEIWEKTLVAPAPLMPCRCRNRAPSWFLRQNHPLLQKNYELEALGDFRGRSLVRVTVTPFRQEYDSTVLLQDFTFRLRGARRIDSKLNDMSEEQARYVMVVPPGFEAALSPLIEYHQSRGTQVLIIDYLGQSFQELRAQLHALYQEQNYQFALLVGHENLIPTEYVRTSADLQTPSDMNYFTMGGVGDRIPDVYYGRLVVQDATQVRDQVNKILAFNHRSVFNPNLITVASDEGFNPTDIEYANRMAAPMIENLGFERFSFVQGHNNSRAQNIIDQLNQGSEWLNYIGHGEGDRWPSITGDALTVDDFQYISQTNRLPIVIDVACQNGRMTLDRRIGERLMNHRFRGLAAGAVAYYGGSVDISWHPPAAMAVYINEYAASNNSKELGRVIMQAQLKLLETYDDLPSALENLVWYHLQGDPAMVLQFD
jgi:hypothetical protein